MTLDVLASTLTDALRRRHPDVVAAYLFGSWARGENRPASDVDVAVVFEAPRPRTLLGLPTDVADTLSGVLSLPVDVVDLERTAPVLVHRVLRDGRLLFGLDSPRRIAVEVKRRNEYFDLQPVLREYREGAP